MEGIVLQYSKYPNLPVAIGEILHALKQERCAVCPNPDYYRNHNRNRSEPKGTEGNGREGIWPGSCIVFQRPLGDYVSMPVTTSDPVFVHQNSLTEIWSRYLDATP
jgi:hypothetical protein